MKNKKLNLNELKVESFVTSLDGNNSQTVKGGTGPAMVVIEIMAETLMIGALTAMVAIPVAIAVNHVKGEKVCKNTPSPCS